MKRCIITYAANAHEELLDISLPTYKEFARLHGYQMLVGSKLCDLPPAWNKIPLILDALSNFEEVVWFDCDLIVVNNRLDFPLLTSGFCHSMVRHFENNSEVPNSGVWRLKREATELLTKILELQVFRDHGWWEQAALMTLMGYTVPPQGSDFLEARCKCVQHTHWTERCSFMRVAWNSHPNYRAEHPNIIHCSYPNMLQRIGVMRELVKDSSYEYPRYDVPSVRGDDPDRTTDSSSDD